MGNGIVSAAYICAFFHELAFNQNGFSIHIFPPIEYAALAGNTAEGYAIPMDRQLRLVQRLCFKAGTVQGNTNFLEVAELLLLVVVIHSKNSFP